ncbi:MAG: NCS2 family permease [Selenomonadaceae bacterium]|nr:NCS2 family permease [Selenomonadaceae bacterium]
MEALSRYFKFEERGTNLRTEILAGITTFLAMVYIVIVAPTALMSAGMDFGGVYVATVIATVVGTLIMGAVANYPIAISCGLGILAYVAYTLILSEGIPWQEALGAAAISSGIFIVLSLTQFREMFINSIPESLKRAIAAGIGMFIALIGFHNGHIVMGSEATMVTMGSMDDPTLVLTLMGLAVTMALMVLRVNGSIFIGMIFTAVVAWTLGYWETPKEIFSAPNGFSETFMQLRIGDLGVLAPAIFTLLLVTLFDTTGTMLGVGRQAGLIKNGEFPNLKSALMADATASFVGAFCGTSPTSTYVESGTGVSAGGRTGFTSVVTAALFALMVFFQPLAASIASLPAVTAPALILTGCFMVSSVATIDWDDYTEAFPAFFTMVLMPFTYSITNGVGAGMIFYVLLKIFAGRIKEIHPLLLIMAVLFAVQMAM